MPRGEGEERRWSRYTRVVLSKASKQPEVFNSCISLCFLGAKSAKAVPKESCEGSRPGMLGGWRA